jgi:acetolactate synthase-1/2/3 large subunit
MINMKGSDAILEMLEKYSVKHVFGLIGETSFPLYESWEKYPNLNHILVRDERSAAMMADGYSRGGVKPGICEVPGVGASYTLPGIIEAYNSGTPMIVLSSDISLTSEKRNFLTEYDKSGMFKQLTKEYITVNNANDIPRLIRRAFRIATTGRMGPVFIRFPFNTYLEEVSEKDLYIQEVFSNYPSLRTLPPEDLLNEALNLIERSRMPIIVAGQGVLLSHAEQELQEFADIVRVPVATTISGKGAVSEMWDLSLGVIGSRGGTDFSNEILSSADLIFFIGTNTDSASTSEWKNPPIFSIDRKIIHLDVSEYELGNNYPTDLFLYGDAKLTLRSLSMIAKKRLIRKFPSVELLDKKKAAIELQKKLSEEKFECINPIKFIKILQDKVPIDSIIASDPGIGAIYSSAYFKVSKPKRKFIYNYAVGVLGFSIPAAIGAYYATGRLSLALTTDGSLAFSQGEFETMKRYNTNVKVIIINNGSFGWIRATMMARFNRLIGKNEFSPIDYSALAKAYGLPFNRAEKDAELENMVRELLNTDGPSILEIFTEPEDKIVPPVPEWKDFAQRHGLKYMG